MFCKGLQDRRRLGNRDTTLNPDRPLDVEELIEVHGNFPPPSRRNVHDFARCLTGPTGETA